MFTLLSLTLLQPAGADELKLDGFSTADVTARESALVVTSGGRFGATDDTLHVNENSDIVSPLLSRTLSFCLTGFNFLHSSEKPRSVKNAQPTGFLGFIGFWTSLSFQFFLI